jgi:hypothetical protein
MRRFLALATLLVLSLSRFGVAAPAPVRGAGWSESRHPHELVTPTVRFDTVGLREAVPRLASRAMSPWLPFHGTELVRIAGLTPRPADRSWAVERSSLGAWVRVTYDATAPPRFS